MDANSKLGVGVIGIGHWGPNIVRSFATNRRVHLVSVCDAREAAFAKIAHLLYNGCRRVTDPSSVFESSDVDAVAIVTPASTHFELVKAALLAGKHVFCEKPLALDVDESQYLCDLADRVGRKLMVGFTFLFNNGIRKVKEFVTANSLGDLYYLTSVRTHLGLIRADVSSVWDLAPHDVSIMNYLLGTTPEKVSAVGAGPLGSENADFAFINLFYPQGIVGQVHVSWLNSSKERILKIIGSKAKVEFDDLNALEPVRFYEKGIGFADHVEPDFGSYRYLLRDGNIISPKVEMPEPLGQMINAFVQLVLENKQNIADGSFAVEVTRTLVAAHKSMLEHGAPQELATLGAIQE